MVAYANYFNDARIKNYVDALLGAGYQVDVYALGEGDTTPRPGLRVVALASKVVSERALPYVFALCVFFVRALLAISLGSIRRRYDLVHVHNMPDFVVFSALLARAFGSRVILDVHDTMPEAYATKFDLALDHPLIACLRFEERASARLADLVITTNELQREALIGHGIPERKIALIMNVGNPAIFHPLPPRSRPGQGLVLGYHGTVALRLGLDLVIEAVRRALPACPGLRFVLLGGGEFLPALTAQVAAYGLQDVVSLRGWVPVEELPDALADVDVGIVGNRQRTELRQNWMLPVKMLEYAAMEIPTIAPRLRVITHYFDDDTALLYRPDDADDLARVIREVYTDRTHLARLRAGLQAFNARYNWRGMEARYLELVAGANRSTAE